MVGREWQVPRRGLAGGRCLIHLFAKGYCGLRLTLSPCRWHVRLGFFFFLLFEACIAVPLLCLSRHIYSVFCLECLERESKQVPCLVYLVRKL